MQLFLMSAIFQTYLTCERKNDPLVQNVIVGRPGKGKRTCAKCSRGRKIYNLIFKPSN